MLYLQSPSYPSFYNLNQKCTYLVKVSEAEFKASLVKLIYLLFLKAPENFKLQITIIDLSIEDNDRHDSCNDYLEIRYFNLGQPGPK